MVTTIQISEELKGELAKRKISSSETYEEIIWDLVEDTLEISDETKKEIAIAQREIARGDFVTHEELKKSLGIK